MNWFSLLVLELEDDAFEGESCRLLLSHALIVLEELLRVLLEHELELLLLLLRMMMEKVSLFRRIVRRFGLILLDLTLVGGERLRF